MFEFIFSDRRLNERRSYFCLFNSPVLLELVSHESELNMKRRWI